MNPLRLGCIENFVKVDMLIGVSQPLLSSHDMSNFHLPVINDVGKMKSWPSIAPDYDEIINCLKRNFPKNLVFEGLRPLNQVVFNSYRVRLFAVDTLFDLLEGKASAFARIHICILICL